MTGTSSHFHRNMGLRGSSQWRKSTKNKGQNEEEDEDEKLENGQKGNGEQA